ncbi:MAG: FAD-binding protein, partial [Burkholderiaceae bacterium]
MNQPEPWDVVVVGAGAAGLFCAARAGQHGLRVL